MEYLMIMNTVAFIVLMVEVILFVNTEHKLRGCLYNPDQMWCYTNLHCNYGTDNIQDTTS